MDKATAIRYFNGLARGLGPDMLGAPVDAATQLANLAIAGGGYLGHKAGLIDTPPELIENAVGGSDWIAGKLGNPDDGSTAYTAGRLTPTVVGLAKPAAGGVAKLLDVGLASPRSGSKAAQRGVIRRSVGAGDEPQQDLVMSHSLRQDVLPQLARETGSMELYSPGFGVKRGQVMTEFGDLALIPRVGAFDPAVSNAVRTNRDAYTTRFNGFPGQIAKNALQPVDSPLAFEVRDRSEATIRALTSPETMRWREVPLTEIKEFQPLLNEFRATSEAYGPEKAWDLLSNMDTNHFSYDALKGMGHLGTMIWNSPATPLRQRTAPDLRYHAKWRTHDKLFHGQRPEDLRLNESGSFGVPSQTTGSLAHDISIETSPVFRSFRSYERNPLGAGLLSPPDRAGLQNVYQNKVLDVAYGDNFGWLPRKSQVEAAALAGKGPQGFLEALKSRNKETGYLSEAYEANGFSLDEMFKDGQQLLPHAQKARRALQHTPSDYAEVKALGPVQITPDTFAGVIAQGNVRDEIRDLLARNNLPLILRNSADNIPKSDLELVNQLQAGNPYYKRPAK
jgi:hypothetical protein